MSHRRARLGRLAFVAMLLGLLGGSTWSAPAAACSCERTTTRQIIERALVIVSGEPVDRWTESDYNVWAFEVDERWVGVTPDVVEVQAYAGETSCGGPADVTASILRLAWKAPNGRFDVSSGCSWHTVSRAVVDSLFEPPELFAGGEPVAAVSADAGGHAAKLVDADGRAIRYLPGEGETHGFAPCPGGEHFVQLRGGSGDEHGLLRSFELATWRYDGWTEVAVQSVESPEATDTAETIVCLRPDGGEALIVWSGSLRPTRLIDGVDSKEPRSPVHSVDVPGPAAAALRLSAGRPPQVFDGTDSFDVVWDLGGGSTRPIQGDNLMSVTSVADGWELTVDEWREFSPDTTQYGFRVIRLGLDGQAVASPDFVPIVSTGWSSGMLIPADRRTTAGLAATVPPSLFERSGHAEVSTSEPDIDRTDVTGAANAGDGPVTGTGDAPLAGGAPFATVAPSGSTTVSDDVADSVNGNDSTWARWVVGGMLALIVIGGVALIVRRSDGGRDESPPPGGDS